MTMFVIKRDGREEPVAFDKITARINKLSYGLNAEFWYVNVPLRCAGISRSLSNNKSRHLGPMVSPCRSATIPTPF
tara:strand:+ start:1371 stop:1598 length:228 start_codon:yes stop_codon:yes gene_type:complete